MRPTSRSLASVILATLAAVLAGCASGGGPGAEMTRAAPAAPAAAMKAEMRGLAYSDADSGPAQELKVIRSADFRVAVDDFDAAGAAVVRLAESSGGFVLSSSRERYSIKVPATGFDSALAAVAALGEVQHRGLSGTDVTAEYHDLEARLGSAEKARDGYLVLLEKASTVGEILQVERALNEVQERIESMKGRLEYLKRHVALATIDVWFVEHRTPGPLKLIWDGLVWLGSKLIWL